MFFVVSFCKIAAYLHKWISGYSVRETAITDVLYHPWISRLRDSAV